MDLTVVAVPGYFASIEAERRWLQHRSDDPAFDDAQYETKDTWSNLAMGTASLLAPLVASRLTRHLAIGRSRWSRPAVAAVAGGAALTTALDVWRRRRAANSSSEHTTAESGTAPDPLTRVGGASAVATIAGAVLVAGATWNDRLSPDRLWRHRRTDLGGGPVAVLAAIAGWDVIYYWNHRISHESRLNWAVHVVHHSSERYNLSVALRQPVADALGLFVPYGLLSLLGIRPAHIETARGVNLLYQYWIHTEAIPKLGPAERVLNTPSAHRVHHGSNRRYLDRNHGSILILWDRLFGTFEPEGEKVVYGLTTNIGTFNPLRIAGREHRLMAADVARASTWRDRLSYVFRPPGWRPSTADPSLAVHQ